MKRIRIAAASVMVAAGLIGAVAAPAAAAKPANYGSCVSGGIISPAEGQTGPLNFQGFVSSDEKGGTIVTGASHSGDKPRLIFGRGCA